MALYQARRGCRWRLRRKCLSQSAGKWKTLQACAEGAVRFGPQLSVRICMRRRLQVAGRGCREELEEAVSGHLGFSSLPESAGGGGSCRLMAEAESGVCAAAVCQNLQVEAEAAGFWQRL